MINYLTTDTLPEIVDKNKSNILYLLQEFADGGISYKDLVAKVEANAVTAAKAVSDAAAAQAKADSHDQPISSNATAALDAQQKATQAVSDAAAAQAKADSHDQPIITNAAAALAAQQKADQNAADIVKAIADINANAAAIARIINDGIGGYLGTYRATDGDDFTVLPQSANDKERAITEFPENDEIFYQEWEWKTPGGWTKLGSKTDSHIHSQSAGISLADVARQQDPKITAAVKDLEDKVPKLTDIKYEKGRVLSYAEQKTTGAFADRTLFSELPVKEGYSLTGKGTTATIIETGKVGSHRHIGGNWTLPGTFGTTGFPYGATGSGKYLGGSGSQTAQQAYTSQNTISKNDDTQIDEITNYGAGHKIIAYVYTALKDITFAEMK